MRRNRFKQLHAAGKTTMGPPVGWLHRLPAFLLPFAIGALLTASGFILQRMSPPQSTPVKSVQRARTLEELLTMTPDQLARLDIAETNLLCAKGLPGAENLDIDQCLAKLDQWAARVKQETERHLYRLTDPAYKEHAEHYQHSEARFRAEWLVSVLQKDIGLHYHAGFVGPGQPIPLPKTSKEHFIHGLMDDDDAHKAFGGDCVSLPVAYAAVGRRLGYPIKIVTALEHAFCRWEGVDSPNPAWRDRFNFDGAGNGFSIDPDGFYLSWPRKCNPENVELCGWLKSLTPQQELSIFLGGRAHMLGKLCKDYNGALVAYSQSYRLWSPNRAGFQEVEQTLQSLWTLEVAAHPDIYRKSYGVQVVDGRVIPVKTAGGSQQRPSSPVPEEADGTSRKNLPWWATEAGRNANIEEVLRINEENRRRMEMMSRPPTPPQRPSSPGVPGT